jgi:DNA-binding transcriptional LysR family regulator
MQVVRTGTLAGAAKVLGVNYTTIARRIGRAEDAMGVKLFERLADGYQPTPQGTLVAQHVTLMETHADDLMRAVQRQDATLSGALVVTAPQLLIGHALAPVIDQFCTRYPDVDLQVRATNNLLDLSRREADLALRISSAPGETLTGLRLTPQQTASFAAPAVAARIAGDPDDMIDWIVFADAATPPKHIDPRYPHNRVRMSFDDMVAIVGAAQSGLGVARLPLFLGRSLPGLVQVPVLPPQPYADVWLVGHRDVWPAAKVKAFRDVLIPHFRKIKPLFVA